MDIPVTRWSVIRALKLAVLPMLIIAVMTLLALLFHIRAEHVTEAQLRERLLNIVTIAALQFDADDLSAIQSINDLNRPEFVSVVNALSHLREVSPHVRFAYIMRRTDDPLKLAFVADADALSSVEELDVNGNGVVDDDEVPGLPGDSYDISDLPVLQSTAFLQPVVDPEITIDQWGHLISSYAPIKNEFGQTVAILGMDVKADEFYRVTQQTFSMVAVALVGLLGIFLALYIVVILRLRKSESMKQLEADRSALMDLAMHQLGMPLATFRWWLEILREEDDGRFCKKGGICEQLQEGIDRMDIIIKSLKHASDLTSSSFRYSMEKTSVEKVINKAISDTQKIFDFRRQAVSCSIEQSVPAVLIDSEHMNAVFREILENASFYSKEGSTINVRVAPTRGGVEISVEDAGGGIPEQDLPHLFEKFKRGSNAMSMKPVGNGMGLYIAKEVIERHGGRIKIKSTLNKGTTVIVTLPRAS